MVSLGFVFALMLAFASQPLFAQDGKKAPPPLDTYHYVLGTQAIGGRYQFTSEPPLVEAARAILGMGSNTIKFSLAPDKTDTLKPKSLTETARDARSVRAVLDMPFSQYLLWAYPVSAEANRFQPASLPGEYAEMYGLTRYLLQTYVGTGKTFYLGNWEGDWHLTHTNPNYTPTDAEVQNMIAWANMRQKAVDDARRDTPHQNVQVYYYLEVNRVVDAMQGKVRLTNAVLPKTNVDYVSYSSYDTLGGNIEANLPRSLDYIQAHLPPKPGVPGKRVFIGEYGFAALGITSQEQDRRARLVMRAALKWGCPFALYWEMFNNEVTKDGKQRGFWLIDDHAVKQPAYFTHQRFYAQAHRFVAEFAKTHGRSPTPEEFGAEAAKWLDAPPLSLPSVLSDGMMFQQGEPLRVWGRAAPGESVSVALRQGDKVVRRGTARADAGGNWTVELPPLQASFTPCQFTASDSADTLTVKDVLIGEVWLAGGQSNMELSLPDIIGGKALLAQAHNPDLRFFCQDHIPDTSRTAGFSPVPLWDVSGGGWVRGDSPDALRTRDVSGIGYAFARSLFAALNKGGHHVPVAVLNTATGATSIQAWLSPGKIKSDPALMARYPRAWYAGGDWRKGYNQATAEFNHKIAPLAPLNIRGFLWAQGENDVGGQDAADYYRLALTALIGDWRGQFHAPQAPFLATQLAPHFYYADLATAAELREAQREACDAAPPAVALPIHDLPLTWNVGPFRYKDPIHPLDKVPVGQRLARAALALAYGETVEYDGPRYEKMQTQGDMVALTFTHAGSGFQIKDGPALRGFAVCGPDRVFFPAQAQITSRQVRVWSSQVPHPVAVTYGFTSLNQDANLFNGAGLPANPFRTDKIASHYCHPPHRAEEGQARGLTPTVDG